jgi:hypothetical protein
LSTNCSKLSPSNIMIHRSNCSVCLHFPVSHARSRPKRSTHSLFGLGESDLVRGSKVSLRLDRKSRFGWANRTFASYHRASLKVLFAADPEQKKTSEEERCCWPRPSSSAGGGWHHDAHAFKSDSLALVRIESRFSLPVIGNMPSLNSLVAFAVQTSDSTASQVQTVAHEHTSEWEKR